MVGNTAIFTTLLKATDQLDDWGIAMDISHYCKLDNNLSSINMEIEWLNTEVDSICIEKVLCEGRLKLAHAPKQLAHMECIAPTHLWHTGNKQTAIWRGWRKNVHGCTI